MNVKEAAKRFEGISTPFYYYDTELLDQTLDAAAKWVEKNDYHVHYALKANSNPEIIRRIASKGFGADCVSGNEIERAVECGFKPQDIAFAGVGKTDEEIRTGLRHDIFSFNCESIQELDVINEIAGAEGKQARIALRINPNVNANTHKYITTGLEENKFGINMWELDAVLEKLAACPNLVLEGIHFHIGSQVTDLDVYKGLCLRVNEIQQVFIDRHVRLNHVNVGGGLGIDYYDPDTNSIPDFDTFFGIFEKHLELRKNQSLHFELGRAFVGQCGSLVTKVLYVKNGIKANFAIVDAGMTELIRPALYQSYHLIQNLSKNGSETISYDVVGPICESSDCFGKAVDLPETERGDLLVLRSCGGYGEVMTSGYNLRDKVSAVYSEEL